MKVQTTAGQLRAGLHLFRGVIQRRNTIPVLGTVRFADGRLTGTDLDIEVSVALPSIGKMEGKAVIDWASLRALSGCVDADEAMTISDAEGRASISFNGSEYSMPSIAVSDFPDFQQPEGTRSAIGNIGLIDAMRRIRFAISSEQTRYYLNGVALLVDAQDHPLIAATDGHRMAYQMLDALPDGAAGAIIPRDLVHYLCSLKAAPDFCAFDAERNRVSFELPGMTVAGKLIDGKFPDIFRAIPKDPKPVFSIERQPLLRVLMRMRAFHSGWIGAVKLEGGGSELTLTLAHGGFGQNAVERLSLTGAAAAPFVTGYNVDYLISALRALRGEEVVFAADHGITSDPAVITCADDELRIVQMPMRV